MQDLQERIRRFHEQMISRSGRAMRYWEKVPPFRMGEEFLSRSEKLIEALTTGKGGLREIAMDISFLCFLFAENGPEIKDAMLRLKNSPATEDTASEPDPDREEWERKRAQEGGNEPWRG